MPLDAEKYQQSMDDPQTFWAEQATRLDWSKPWETVLTGDLTQGDITWFAGGQLNVSYNCLDRHLPKHADKVAIIWEGDEPDQSRQLTFTELHQAVCQFANGLKQLGVVKGDRVCIYLPMIVEAAIAMLACCRIGAVHSVVFGGFSAEALNNRIVDADCKWVITADAGQRGGKVTHFKENVDKALQDYDGVEKVIVISHSDIDIAWCYQRDVGYEDLMATAATDCPVEPMDAEDPLFILYTSGSTGKPKGVLHTTAGYLLYAALTHQSIFDIQPDDVYWCTADVGWITGHSYIVYGPLANATTTLMFAGTPEYPTPARVWQVIDRYKVNVFYTAPTAIRALMKYGDEPVQSTSRQSLRILGTVGEPINPEAWQWYCDIVGASRCPIMDTWWQTETGGFMLAPPNVLEQQKPGYAMRPFYGVDPVLLDEQGQEILSEGEGLLMIKRPWPGMMRTVFGDHQRFMETYLTPYPGYYFTGDSALRDADGDYRISGRVDDILNIAGHRLGTAEVESVLVEHKSVVEAAIVGVSDPIKGEAMYAYVTPIEGVACDDVLRQELIQMVRQKIGAFASVKAIQFATELPKTRSGKIMRRILRKIASGQVDALGDVSTLANPDSVKALLADCVK